MALHPPEESDCFAYCCRPSFFGIWLLLEPARHRPSAPPDLFNFPTMALDRLPASISLCYLARRSAAGPAVPGTGAAAARFYGRRPRPRLT